MNAKQGFLSTAGAAGLPFSAEPALADLESDEAFKIIVTLREAIEAADSVKRRLEGTSDRRYASFLTKARERHLQIAETARRLLVEMIVTMSGDRVHARRGPSMFAKRPD